MTTPLILFMHIPKAAGTTLRSILDLQYGRTNVITYYNQPNAQLLENLDYMLTAARHDYKALIGHFGFGVHEKLSRPSRYITFVREPISRAVSSYYENVKRGTSTFFDGDGNAYSLAECIEKEEQSFANGQIKMITGKENSAHVDETDLSQAFTNLELHFDFVGLTELFNPSLLLLSKKLAWKPCAFGHLNTRQAPPKIGPKTMKRLAELNSLETKFYDQIKLKVEKLIGEQTERFHNALSALEHLTADIAKNGRHPQDAHVPADTPLPLRRHLNC
jgi:hypothetical protein